MVPNVKLHDGHQMPLLGFGVYQVEEGREVIDAVSVALETGYRSIDTAALYANEHGVGQAIKDSGVPRQDIFLTSKVWNSDQGYDSTLRAFEASLHKLDTDYLDLYLIHWFKAPTFADTWRALERIQAEGGARSIGVSNFQPHHLDQLAEVSGTVPAVNQVELHPLLPQQELRAYCTDHHIQVEAWSPIMRGKRHLEHPTLTELANKHQKTPAQVVLRWHLQQKIVAIPKSVTPERIRSNFDIFDFELSDDDMRRIGQMATGERLGPDPDNVAF